MCTYTSIYNIIHNVRYVCIYTSHTWFITQNLIVWQLLVMAWCPPIKSVPKRCARWGFSKAPFLALKATLSTLLLLVTRAFPPYLSLHFHFMQLQEKFDSLPLLFWAPLGPHYHTSIRTDSHATQAAGAGHSHESGRGLALRGDVVQDDVGILHLLPLALPLSHVAFQAEDHRRGYGKKNKKPIQNCALLSRRPSPRASERELRLFYPAVSKSCPARHLPGGKSATESRALLNGAASARLSSGEETAGDGKSVQSGSSKESTYSKHQSKERAAAPQK